MDDPKVNTEIHLKYWYHLLITSLDAHDQVDNESYLTRLLNQAHKLSILVISFIMR